MSALLDRRLVIRPLEARDVDAVLAIQSSSPEMAHWTIWDYNRVAAGEMAGWVAEEKGEIAGFLVARQIGGDVEILNVAVAPDVRRHGVGSALFEAAIGWAKSLGAERAFLEVRQSNHAAIQFYERYNFRATGHRPRYYTSPVEDALVLALHLTRKP
ncbi:MAG TPA: ribosomal protein S18-alanine N-acetyltransferase [Candidatus Acidoferrales bacterium]|nr:ribosomal protein S18-alanine N-acetyltransferase [Candidatus Acidoferrales bacterium]